MNTSTDAPPAITHPGKACANCGAPMHGPFCYACGQPEKGMIRHLASVLADVGDTIFNVDSRIFRSLPPLYFRPGFLTTEYFVGRRTRYVTPFRLFFFLCIIAFFAIQFSLNLADIHFGGDDPIDSAQTEPELQQRTDAALHDLEAGRAAASLSAGAAKSLQKASDKVRARSERRLAWLKERQAAEARGEKPPTDPSADEPFGDFPVLHVTWLPQFANAKLNEAVVHAKQNFAAARGDPGRFFAGLFSVLPQTLFVLMPLFALLLKITYLFKRRLYMEHLMVALHSHAFICLSLLLLALVQLLLGWTADSAAWMGSPLRFLRAAIWIWLPVYLFLMQKRIYRQGWLMTTLKYGFVGFCYVVMLSFGAAAAFFVSLVVT